MKILSVDDGDKSISVSGFGPGTYASELSDKHTLMSQTTSGCKLPVRDMNLVHEERLRLRTRSKRFT